MTPPSARAPRLPAGWKAVPRRFYRRHPVEVAPELLNKLLVRDDGRAGRIVEVEAYAGSEDPAAHSFRGMTARNATMFGEPGHMYVYFTYGLHWGSNAVCGEVGEGAGVLLRAIEPVAGIERMRALRPAARRDRDLANGPGKLSQAMGLDRSHDGADLVRGWAPSRLAPGQALRQPAPLFRKLEEEVAAEEEERMALRLAH